MSLFPNGAHSAAMKNPAANYDDEIKVRLPGWLKRQAAAIAASEDLDLSHLVRKALKDLILKRQSTNGAI